MVVLLLFEVRRFGHGNLGSHSDPFPSFQFIWLILLRQIGKIRNLQIFSFLYSLIPKPYFPFFNS